MMNLIELLPANVSAAQAAGEPGELTAAGAPQTGSLPASASGDNLAYGPSGAAALAYSPYAQNGKNATASLPGVASGAERDEALAARFGPGVALVRAALPNALQGQFVAQLMAADDGAAAAEPPARGGSALSEHDLAKLISAGLARSDDGTASVLVSRLAQDVARYGSASVAQALHLAHDRIAFAADVAPPGAQYARVARRDGESDDDRRRPRDERPERSATPGDVPLAEDPNPIYTIEDVVRFGDTTIATHRMASPPPDIERNPA